MNFAIKILAGTVIKSPNRIIGYFNNNTLLEKQILYRIAQFQLLNNLASISSDFTRSDCNFVPSIVLIRTNVIC